MPESILVVDDDDLSQFVVAEMCQELGYDCITAGNGRHAIDILIQNAADVGLVLMDIHMPGVSGVDATKEIRDCSTDPPRNVPIVATTADVHWQSQKLCDEHGFQSFLTKPVSLDSLSEVLRRYASG